MEPAPNPWDEFAVEYAQDLRNRGPVPTDDGGIMARLLECLGDIEGKRVLDAGCGEGLLARVLAGRGAHVTGIDLSPRLVAMAKEQDPDGKIDYRVGDLSEPHPDLIEHFDAIGSYLVLNDVQRYQQFAQTLAAVVRPGAPIVLAFNNPYSSVVREHVKDYFASGTLVIYGGMWQRGIKAHYYHRTLEDYLTAFLAVGLRLERLIDVADVFGREWVLSPETRFPFFMILAFRKDARER